MLFKYNMKGETRKAKSTYDRRMGIGTSFIHIAYLRSLFTFLIHRR